jgi:hypothetical protein
MISESYLGPESRDTYTAPESSPAISFQTSIFGQPFAGRFTRKDCLIAARQSPFSFNRSSLGPRLAAGFLLAVERFIFGSF